MKKMILFSFLAASLLSSATTFAQGNPRPSPADTVRFNGTNGLMITLAYSQPSVKGRTIGKDIAPYGKVWRTGANEATTIELNRDVKIQGQNLPAGKYSIYSIPGENEWTVIFNKTWKQWGTVYKEEEDALRVKAKPTKAPAFAEKMTFALAKDLIILTWGDTQVSLKVQ
jgi:hypothetical protein